jgi:integrase
MARGSIVKRASGNYAIVYYVGGKQRWETIGPSRREAERALTVRKREVDMGTWREPSSETLASYAKRWLAHRDPARVGGGGRTRLSASTFEGYRLNLRRHVVPRIGDRALSSLRMEEVDGLIAELEADGKAPGTVRNVIVPLRKMLADAVRHRLLVANPAARADLPPAQDFAGKEIPAAHTDAIRESLRELAPFDPLRREPDLFFVCLFDVALGTGLRLGELRALRWRDVNRERRLIRVEHAYSRQELRRPKTESGIRAVPLFPSVHAAFRELSARAVERGRYAPDELVFASIRGTPLQPSNFRQRIWDLALRLADLDGEGYRFHDLRHTCVSRLVADVKLVQAVAGHANPLTHTQAVLTPARRSSHRGGGALRSRTSRVACALTLYEDTPVDDLVVAYADNAAAHGAATSGGDSNAANRHHDAVAGIYRELRRRGQEAPRALLQHLDDRDPWVRCWAASHALEFAPLDGERVLSELATSGGLEGFTAKTTLAEWRKGTLRFP